MEWRSTVGVEQEGIGPVTNQQLSTRVTVVVYRTPERRETLVVHAIHVDAQADKALKALVVALLSAVP
eukprot:34164-Eustigmatos_ZCMA.PRE.1